MKTRTLIIHSHQPTNLLIKEDLESKGYQCNQATTKQELEHYLNETYDCIIFDDSFPNIQIEDYITQFKLNGHPILIILTHTVSQQYHDELLNLGADDYLIEPYSIKDIDNKIQSIYKNGILKPRTIYHFKDIELDITQNTCFCHQKSIQLTKNEFKLLSILIAQPYQPFSSTYLFEHIWGSSIYEDEQSIMALVNQVIMKLNTINPKETYIKRFGKNGYKMAF